MKFSIIVRTYNRKKQILRSLKSILSQTYQNYEILIIDDQSSDGTKEYIHKTINDKRIKYFYLKKNIGHIKTSEYGLNKSTGDIVCFLDDDDTWNKKFLYCHFKAYVNNSDIQCVYNNTITVLNGKKIRPYYSNIDGNCYNAALKKLHISSQIALSFKRSCWKKLKNLDHKINSDDDDLCLRLSKFYKFKHIDKDLSLAYLENNRSQITSNALNHAKYYKQLFNKYKKDIYIHCSAREIANHYYVISKKFFLANSFKESKKNIIRSLKLYPGIKTLFVLILLLFKMQKNFL
jgi:glycosyltransferase involved in cell wall biosynthesis